MNNQHSNMMADAMTLHQEFPMETAFLVEFMQVTVHAVKSNFNYNKSKWERHTKIYDFDVWADAIDAIDDRLKDNKAVLKKDAATFARLLFHDGYRIFTLHCLFSLCNAIPENDRFNNRVIQLFA